MTSSPSTFISPSLCLPAVLIFGYLKQRTGKSLYGLLGALLFLSLPVVVKLSITVYVDLGLIFFPRHPSFIF